MPWLDLGDVTGPQGIAGESGSQWYVGTGITGTRTDPLSFQNSGVSVARPKDIYFNSETCDIYECVDGGEPTTATWVWKSNIRGKQGEKGEAAKIDEQALKDLIEDVNTNVVKKDMMAKADGVATLDKNATIPENQFPFNPGLMMSYDGADTSTEVAEVPINADQLGGNKPEYFAKQTDMTAVQKKVEDNVTAIAELTANDAVKYITVTNYTAYCNFIRGTAYKIGCIAYVSTSIKVLKEIPLNTVISLFTIDKAKPLHSTFMYAISSNAANIFCELDGNGTIVITANKNIPIDAQIRIIGVYIIKN